MEERNFKLQEMRYQRLSRKITTKEVAEALDISVTSYYKKESGEINITVEELAVILDTLGIERSKAGMFY